MSNAASAVLKFPLAKALRAHSKAPISVARPRPYPPQGGRVVTVIGAGVLIHFGQRR